MSMEKTIINDVIDFIIDKNIKSEYNVHYNKNTKKIQFDRIEMDNSQEHLLRLGTIGPLDLNTAGVNELKSSVANIIMYEVDDGNDMYNRPHVTAQIGHKVKRTFIDSSIVELPGLKSYLKEKAASEGWYQKMIEACCDEKKKKEAGLV